MCLLGDDTIQQWQMSTLFKSYQGIPARKNRLGHSMVKGLPKTKTLKIPIITVASGKKIRLKSVCVLFTFAWRKSRES